MKKLKGIKKIAGQSKDLKGYYSDRYLQINVDTATGEVWGDEHVAFNKSWQTLYNNNNVICCGFIDSPKTMAEIKEMVEMAIEQFE